MRTDDAPDGRARFDRPLVNDPAEDWELPCSRRQGASYFSGIASYPRTPGRWEEIPAAALASLKEYCAIEELGQVFVIPWAVRSVDVSPRRFITPNSVLAIGSRAVGLWTDKPEPGMKAGILLEDLAAIEDINILLYGRLGFFSKDGRVTIRYNTVARRSLEPALLALRKRLAGPAEPVPREAEAASPLPFKWNYFAQSMLVRLREDAVIAYRFAEAPGASRRDLGQAHLLALNPQELVYLKDPYCSRYGADAFIVPRSAISEVRIREKLLDITSNEARFRLAMMPELRDAAVRWLS